MTITIEQVENIKKRMSVTYKEAKEALEATGGNELEAMILLESKGKNHQDKKNFNMSAFEGLGDKLATWIKWVHRIQFIIKKDSKTILALPLTVVLIMACFMMPFMIIGLFAGWAFGYQY